MRSLALNRRTLAVALVLAVAISALPAASAPMASTGDVLFNGGFEQGFVAVDGCGMVGKAWGCFNNGGTAAYGFYDDMWDPVVYQGEHSQLIEINTKQMGGDGDRNAGIFQTVWVKPHGEYELALKGMIRADDGGGDPWRYRVYVGFDYHGGQDWQAVEDWRELAWDTYYPRTEPGEMQSYSARFEAPSAMTTIWLMAIKKWATLERELDVNLDNVQLRACRPAKAMWPMHDGALMPMGPEQSMMTDISQRQDISKKFLEKIIRSLKQAGFIKSVRGPKGGHQLAMDPKDITVGDIVRVLEGDMALVDCEKDEGLCRKAPGCLTRIWTPFASWEWT